MYYLLIQKDIATNNRRYQKKQMKVKNKCILLDESIFKVNKELDMTVYKPKYKEIEFVI